MKLQTVAAAQGLLWVRRSVQVFRQRPVAFAMLFASFMAAVFMFSLLPLIGPLLVVALLPLLSLAFMIATRRALEGGTPTAAAFIEPLRGERKRLVSLCWLGALYAGAVLGGLELLDLLDGGSFEAMMDGMPRDQGVSPEVMAAHLMAPGLMSGMALRFGLLTLLALPFWHAAPALVFWEGQSAAQALFTSVLSCWRNLAALAVCGLCWLAMLFGVAMSGGLLFTLIGAPQLFALAAIPIWLLFATLFYTALYFPYLDCFTHAEAPPAIDPPASDPDANHIA